MRRRSLPRNGSVVCAMGNVHKCLEVLEHERPPKANLGLAIAGCDAGLRSVLECRALQASNIVGCVESGAFASGQQRAFVASVDCGDGIEAFTFDSRVGALPDLGRNRLAEALEPGKTPHFVVLAGRYIPSDDEEDQRALDGRVLRSFVRRVDGLFPKSTCSGVVVRGGRIAHARRRVGTKTRRLRVYRADGAAVGVVLLPKAPDVHQSHVADTASLLSTLVLGGFGARNLWSAGEATMGPDEQRVLAAMMRFYQALSDRDLDAMKRLWTDVPSVAHPGRRIVRGRDNVLNSWRDFLAHPDNHLSHADQNLGLDVTDVNIYVAHNLAYATCIQVFNDGLVQATNIFQKDSLSNEWKLAHHHGSANFEDDDYPHKSNGHSDLNSLFYAEFNLS